MRLATFRTTAGDTRAAVQVEDGSWVATTSTDVGALLRTGSDPRTAVTDGVTLGDTDDPAPVVTDPTKIICCGHNYRAHIDEMGRDRPEYPTLFAKFADTLTGARSTIEIPGHAADSIDWEAELAVVVGAELHAADRDTASRAIAGYTVANDISIRSWQRRTPQWLQGKAFDRTTPLGPVLVTPDEIDPADGLSISCHVNGVERQMSSTDDLLFDVPELLSYISGFTTLNPGDVVLTGTPGGVGAGFDPPLYLNDGDVLETRIAGIGLLSNTIRVVR